MLVRWMTLFMSLTLRRIMKTQVFENQFEKVKVGQTLSI